MEKAIEQTKLLIAEEYDDYDIANSDSLNVTQFDIYHGPFYWFTNENIDTYLDAAEFKTGQKALSVLASGDHVFNLIAKGIKDIDTFDINKLTEYYVLGLKMAIITKYNYLEFMEIYSKLLTYTTPASEIIAIIHELLPFMDEKYRKYWREILDFYIKVERDSKFTKNGTNPLKMEPVILSEIKKMNTYLKEEENYNQFKTNLMQSNITFTHSNVTDLADNFKGKYDYLLLSNILDYIYKSWGAGWDKRCLNKYLKSLSPILNDNGLIFLHYCFSRFKVMRFSKISIFDFDKNDILECKRIDGTAQYMILKRITKI